MSEREKFTAYITKYALTEGILVKTVEDCFDISKSMVKAGEHTFFHDNQWHRHREDAVNRAKEMQAAKLRSLAKQLNRIKALRFEP
jgi:hypothetical protein